MKVISFVNIKGGVAKTVSTVNIATELGKRGKMVLVIDLDPQSNATKYLGLYYPNSLGSYNLLNGEDVRVSITKYENVWLIPANINLIASESEILADTKRARETRLKKWLSNKPENTFDYILIDCPPSLGMISTNALTASDYVLVPLKIDKFSLDGFEYLINSINSAQEEFNSKLKLLGVFVTMDRATKINREVKEELKEELGELLFKQTIRDNVDVIKSTFETTPLIYFNNRAAATKDYRALVSELLCRSI
jgi:chromosome partitioning protein